MADEQKSLSSEAGMTMADAQKALADATVQMAQLREIVTNQGKQLEKLGVARGTVKVGQIPIEDRHCNSCGARVKEGERCSKHKTGKINELGTALTLRGPAQVIVRQV